MFRVTVKSLESSGKAFLRMNYSLQEIGHRNSFLISKNKFLVCSNIRLNSSLSIKDDASLIPSVQEITTMAADPSFSSLGLGGLSPKGLVQHGLEMLHTGLDIPWWSAIVIGTICIRIAMFPLVIIAQRNAANLNNHMPTLQGLQQRMTQARMTGDPKEAFDASQKIMEFMKVNNVNPLRNMMVPIAQVPVFLSVFTAVRQMTGLPVESLKAGGMLWFTDLTIPDPIYLLPVMTVATLAATIELGVDGIKAEQVGSSTIKFVLRAMPFITFPFIINFPSAMLCYWLTSNTFSLVQVLFLKIPRVKTHFSIPEMVDHQQAHPTKEINLPKQTFMESFRESLRNMEIAKEMHERQQLEALKMKESSKKQEESDVSKK